MTEPDPVYQYARRVLEPFLAERGFTLAAECHYPEAFGSAHADYRRRGLRLQLIWDGKDRWLWMTYAVQRENIHPQLADFRDLEASQSESLGPIHVIREGPLMEQRVAHLRAKLVAFLDRAPAV